MPERLSITLASRPGGAPTIANFGTSRSAVPKPSPGEVLTRTLWLSLDPYMRGRMDEGASYATPVALGAAMTGETVGEVVASKDPAFRLGDIVLGARGWETHVLSHAAALTRLPADGPLPAYLGVLGMPGATAYKGLRDIGQPKPGETVVISAASGAVGSVAVQLAKRGGSRVVGVAGGPKKCAYVVNELGADACINHRAEPDLAAALSASCPNGIDIYFENAGGAIQRAVFPLLTDFARVVMCGMAAEYNDTAPRPGPNLRDTFVKRPRIEGFIVLDDPAAIAEWRNLARPWLDAGTLKHRQLIVEGLENAPAAFVDLVNGRNEAKVVVRVADHVKMPARAVA